MIDHYASDGSGAMVALLFFRQIGKKLVTTPMDPPDLGYWLNLEEDPRCFPANPAEAGELVYNLLEYRGPEDPYIIHTRDSRNLEQVPVVDAVTQMFEDHKPHLNASQIYTVHAKSMLLRIFRWGLLRKFSASQMGITYNHVAGRTVDLCEAFNHPAILRYEERASFGTRDIEHWLDFHPAEDDPDPESTLLQMLCMRML